MARSRNIKPGFFKNELLAEISPVGRLFFEGLWCVADREGRLEDRPRRLRAEVMPYDDFDADEVIAQLAERGFVLRYEAGGVRYLQIINFLKHQNPHNKEKQSVIPAAPGFETVKGKGEPKCSPGKAPGMSETSPGHTPDMPHEVPAGFLDSLIPSNTPHTPQGGRKPEKATPFGIQTFMDNCKAAGELPIPEGDAVFDYAKKTKIPREFLNLCFREFVERNIDSGKRYKDWRKAFRNCVRSNWYKLWYADQASGQMVLTTTGIQAQRKHKEAA